MLLSTYLIDKKNIDKGSKQVRKLCFADADSNPAPLAQSEVDELQKQWAAYSEPIMPVLRQVQQLVRRLRLGTEEIPKDAGGTALVGIDAQRKAELLSQLVVKVQELSSKGICIPHSVADAVTIVMDALDSPMLVLRLLGLAATKYMCYDKAFYEKFLAFEGFMLVGICFDSEQPQELDYALTLVQNLTRLKIEGVLDTPIPHYIVSRVVSFLDPIDCRGDATFQLRSQAMDVLRQMLAAFPSEVAAADGVRPLLQVCLNPETSRDEVERTIPAVVRMFEDPVTRVHLRPGDLDVLFCPFTDSTIPDRQRSEIMPVCRDVICKLLCSWGGLFWLSTEASGIRCLIDLLHLPGRSERKFSAISLFNQVLRRLAPHRGIPTQGPWEEKGSTSPVDSFSQDFDVIDGEELLSSYGVNWHQYLDGGVGAADEDDIAPVTSSIGYHSLDVFLGTLLLVLNHHGLPRALISLMRHSAATEEESERGEIETTLMKEAAVLLQHIIVLMDTLLPQSAASSLHAALNEAIASLATDGSTFAGGLTTTLFHNLAYTSQQASIFSQGASFNSNALGVAGVNAVEMDEARFTALVKDTHVDSSEYAKWNLESLFTLVQEPLRNPTRLRFLKEKTPILSRLMQFFRFGSKGGYCSLTVDIHARWTALGIALLDVLLLSRDGVEIIEKGDFCKGIRELIDECNVAQNGAFRQRTENSVMREYFRFLGRFTLYANGLLLLKKHCILESLCSLLQNSHQRSFFDAHPLCCLTLQHLYIGSVPNYGVCDELRAILQAAMSHPDGRIKRVCVAQIGRVLFRDLSSSMEWGVSRLLDGLQDTDLQVVDRSYKLLASVCFSSVHALDYLIDQKPEVLLNSKLVWERRRQLNLSSLLYRMLGRPNGFGFLNKFGWVATELQQWSSRGSSNFVNDLETIVRGGRAQQQATGRTRSHSRTLSDPVAGARGHRQNWGKAVTSVTTALHISHSVFPDHFIQELCRHDAGCAILTASSYFQKCAALLMSTPGRGPQDNAPVSGRRDELHAVGARGVGSHHACHPTPMPR